MNKIKPALTPLLVLLYFFVHYTADLYCFLDPVKVFIQLGIYLLVTMLLFWAGYQLFKNKERYTLAFSTLLFFFLFFGSFTDTAGALHLLNTVAAVDFKVMCGFAVTCIVILVISYRINSGMVNRLLYFWWIYCIVLLVYDAGSVVLTGKAEKKYISTHGETDRLTLTGKPSVFFLLFDMYPSDTVLKKYLGFDNGALGSFLKEKGFFVTGNARSLYPETYYSLSSTLNLKPLDYYADSTVADYKKKLVALKNIEQSRLPGLFERSGYTFRNFSVFNLQGQKSPLRFNLNYHLQQVLTSSTFFNRLYDGFEPDFFLANRNIDLGWIKRSWSDNEKIDIAFLDSNFYRLLDSFPGLQQPSFNYFHFMMPHPPMLYDSSGHELPVRDRYAYNGFSKTNQNFTGYIQYANASLKKMISRIFEKAGPNVVIIVQGDHGYREFPDRFPDAVRYGILNAVYLPGQAYQNLNDSMTPIQSFKEVLINQFGYNSAPEQ